MPFDFIAASPPILIEEVVSGAQTGASVAVRADGNFFVVWQDASVDAGDIKGRILTPDGKPVGHEFFVNAEVAGEQAGPTVARLGDGQMIVVWRSCKSRNNCTTQSRMFGKSGRAKTEVTLPIAGNIYGVRLAYNSLSGRNIYLETSSYNYISQSSSIWKISTDNRLLCSVSTSNQSKNDEVTKVAIRRDGHVFSVKGSANAAQIVTRELACDGSQIGSLKRYKANLPDTNLAALRLYFDEKSTLRTAISTCFFGTQKLLLSIIGQKISSTNVDCGGFFEESISLEDTGGGQLFAAQSVASAFNDSFRFSWDENGDVPGKTSPIEIGDEGSNRNFGANAAAYSAGKVALAYSHGGNVYVRLYDKVTKGVTFEGVGSADDRPELSSVFGDHASGGPGDDYIDGQGGRDKLGGGPGDDTVIGGLGRDTMTGGPGKDAFVFNVEPGDANADVVTDFDSREGDVLLFVPSAYAGIQSGAVKLSAGKSPKPKDGLAATFLYDTSSGELSYDPDGTGPRTAKAVATLRNAPPLSVSDFRVSSFF